MNSSTMNGTSLKPNHHTVRSPANGNGKTVKAKRSIGQRMLIVFACVFAMVFLLLPILMVIKVAFSQGFSAYWQALCEAETQHAILLTVTVCLLTIPINIFFGIAVAWLLSHYQFWGKNLLETLIGLPFTLSPVIVGLAYLLLYGQNSVLGAYLAAHDIHIVFAVPGIVLVTLFVSAPFVARSLIPVMRQQGKTQEEAAQTLGVSGFKLFLYVSLPTLRVPLVYGVLLASARAMGEFGAVSVVAGSIRGQTNTLPLQIQLLFDDYNAVAAFASATVLIALSLLLLLARVWLDKRFAKKPAI